MTTQNGASFNSVAVEHYFMTPNATKKYFPDMYRIVEETING